MYNAQTGNDRVTDRTITELFTYRGKKTRDNFPQEEINCTENSTNIEDQKSPLFLFD